MNEKQEDPNTDSIPEKNIIEYIMERFQDVKNSNKIKNLVSFQAMNKYLLLAHNQQELKILGNIVANNKKNQFSDIIKEYEMHLKKALETEPTIKKHSNVILHIFGYFSNNFNHQEKKEFLVLLDKFKEGNITIGKILSKINPMVYQFNNTYLASQTYFLLYSNPNPENTYELMLKEKY